MEVSKVIHINYNTLYKLFLRFEKLSDVEDRNKLFNMQRLRKSYPPAIAEFLQSKESLLEMKFMTLNDRCALLKKKFKFSISSPTLSKYYKQNKIGYLAVKTQSSACWHNPLKTIRDRTQFLNTLTGLMTDPKAGLTFLDETTFTLTSMPKKLWQPKTYDMRIPYTNQKYESMTLYGSLSLVTNPPFVWMIADSTNQWDFRVFVDYVKTKLIHGFKTKRITYVMDQHSAHVCGRTKDWFDVPSRKANTLIIPSSSS